MIDTSTYISTATNNSVAEVALPANLDPAMTGITITVYARKSGSSAASLTIQLVEGTTVRAEKIWEELGSGNTYEWTLTPAQFDSIVNRNNLRLRFKKPNGVGTYFSVCHRPS